MPITLKHTTGAVKVCPTGFSWTTLFFGFFPALIRGDVKWGLIIFGVSFITCGAAWLVFPFIYNGIYIKGLLKAGYLPAGDSDKTYCASKGYLA